MELVARKIFVLTALVFTFAYGGYAQPSSSFTAPSTGCLNETIALGNTSSSATRYVWDFCHTDLQSINPFANNVTTLPTAGTFFYNSIKLINDNGNNIAFITDTNGVKLYRLNFGSDWSSTNPIIDDLGDFGGLLNSPGAIDAVFDNGVWYLFILNLFGNNAIRVTMGNGLLAAPTLSEGLGNIGGSFSTPIGIKVILNGSSRLIFVSNLSNQSISVIDFSTSFSSTPSLVHGISDSGLTDPSGLDLINDGSNWFGLVSSFDNGGHVVLMNFGNDLLSTPSFSDLGVVTAGRQVRFAKEGLAFTGFVRSENDGVYKITFGADFSSPGTPTKLSPNLINSSRSLDVIKDTPVWKLFTIESTGGNLFRVDFIGDCQTNISTNYSTQATPTNLQYISPGDYFIELTVFDNSNVMAVSSSTITVSSFTSPDIDFTKQNDCVNNAIDFTAINQSGNLISHSWTFGDGGTSSSANPSYIYSLAGTYNVSLVVTDVNGCKNTIQKWNQVFNPPNASFTLPSANPICTGQNYVFTNTSVFDNGSSPTWQWSVNGSNVSTTQDLTYLFTSSSAQSITLVASIPGCSSQSTQNISSVVLGPLISFTSPPTSCIGSSVSFTNTTTDPVTSFSWTFGDGNSSSAYSASNTYSSTGPYQVTLSAANAAGCQNSFSKNISIYSNPQPNFAIEAPPLSCERSLSQFDNLTPPLLDSNITSWLWSFTDTANGSSNQKNPTYTYNIAGNYNVTLQATSNFGCSKSIQKSITIFPSPSASFTYPNACVNQNTIFTSTSQGSITSQQWSIENNLTTGSSLSHTFASSGDFPISLTVTSNNGCVNRKDDFITVPVKPNLDFSVQAPCTLHPTTFQETSANGPDTAVAWNWNFDQGSGTGLTASFQFPSIGVYPVTMTSTRQSGCVYSISKKVTIYDGPVANFTPSVLAGGAPLTVTFVNNSPADTNLWNFGDHVSTKVDAVSPSFTYTTLGAYKVMLTAKSRRGCSDTTSTEIDVVIPHIDIVMNSFSFSIDPTSNISKPVIGILNSGNIPLVNPDVLIDLGGGVSLRGKISGMVKPGKSVVETLDLQIMPQAIQYVCAEINVPDDVNSSNNKQCISLTNEDVVMNPYPNPSGTGQVTLQWVGAVQENVRVTIYKSNGDIAFLQNLDAVQSGLGQFTINTSSFANGLYLIQFAGSKMTKTFRIVIAN